MSKYTIGNKVIKADFEGHGTVIEVMPARRGRFVTILYLHWENALILSKRTLSYTTGIKQLF